uniref:Uncharacterized protein n=1 Tax=Rhizophora mucronata TaxID=61149 RepID=A0A2P2PIF9_RHIMU
MNLGLLVCLEVVAVQITANRKTGRVSVASDTAMEKDVYESPMELPVLLSPNGFLSALQIALRG